MAKQFYGKSRVLKPFERIIISDGRSSTIIAEVLDFCKLDPSLSVAYFYFDFNDGEKQCPENLIRSLLTQFSAQCTRTPDVLADLYSRHQNGQRQPATGFLMTTLSHIIAEFRDAYIILDALDECMERQGLLELIEEILDWNLGNLHILATSRRERDIDDFLASRVVGQVDLTQALVDADIQSYVRNRLRTWKKWPAKVQTEIEETLMEGAHGM